jgi:hypothetical protein
MGGPELVEELRHIVHVDGPAEILLWRTVPEPSAVDKDDSIPVPKNLLLWKGIGPPTEAAVDEDGSRAFTVDIEMEIGRQRPPTASPRRCPATTHHVRRDDREHSPALRK